LKKVAALLTSLIGILLSIVAIDLPQWGDPTSPANTGIANYYLSSSLEKTHTPNVVTSVLGDYRGFDTMLETSVILIAGIAIMSILRRGTTRPGGTVLKVGLQGSLIVKTTCVLLVPTMQLYGLYVLMHGHYSPGGGFQGGVIIAASLIVYSFGFGLEAARKLYSEQWAEWCAYLGVFIYSGIGLLCFALGKNFIDYSALSELLATGKAEARAFGTLGIEIGVCFTVASIMYLIFLDLVSEGYLDEGL
jgi:multicomponent Na+:H+ antiporter subunit B